MSGLLEERVYMGEAIQSYGGDRIQVRVYSILHDAIDVCAQSRLDIQTYL